MAIVNSAVVNMCTLSPYSHVWLFVLLWTVAHQASLSMGFYRQEYWSGLPCSPPGVLPDPGTGPMSLTSPALAGGFFTTRATCCCCSVASHVWLFGTPWTAAHQASLSFISQSLHKPCPHELHKPCPLRWHPAISSSVVPFSFCLHSFPASGSFQRSVLLKVLELQLQHQSFQGIFRVDFL